MRRPAILRSAALLLVALLVVGHAAGVQVVAWTCMFTARLPGSSVAQALASTLDGSRPCGLCVVARSLATHEAAAPADGTGAHPITLVKTGKVPDFHMGEDVPPAQGAGATVNPLRAADGRVLEGHEQQPPSRPPRSAV